MLDHVRPTYLNAAARAAHPNPAFQSAESFVDTRRRSCIFLELLQGRHGSPPEYRVASTLGEAHARTFEVECSVAALALATRGSGRSRRAAEQQAAQAMLEKLAK